LSWGAGVVWVMGSIGGSRARHLKNDVSRTVLGALGRSCCSFAELVWSTQSILFDSVGVLHKLVLFGDIFNLHVRYPVRYYALLFELRWR